MPYDPPRDGTEAVTTRELTPCATALARFVCLWVER